MQRANPRSSRQNLRFGDERDYAHHLTAAGAGERIDLEDAAQQLGGMVRAKYEWEHFEA
jgi:hypothetical protein